MNGIIYIIYVAFFHELHDLTTYLVLQGQFFQRSRNSVALVLHTDRGPKA